MASTMLDAPSWWQALANLTPYKCTHTIGIFPPPQWRAMISLKGTLQSTVSSPPNQFEHPFDK